MEELDVRIEDSGGGPTLINPHPNPNSNLNPKPNPNLKPNPNPNRVTWWKNWKLGAKMSGMAAPAVVTAPPTT